MASDREKLELDYLFVCNHFSDAFGRASFKRTLALMDDVGITGWEKWWQVELAVWLADHDQTGDWVMEERFYTGLRRNTSRIR